MKKYRTLLGGVFLSLMLKAVQGYTSNGSTTDISQGEMLNCGPEGHKVLWRKTSPDHVCCGNLSYSKTSQCCCFDSCGQPRVERKASDGRCCENDLPETMFCGPHNHKVAWTKISPDHVCCGTQTYNKTNQCCCFNGQLSGKTFLRVEPRPSDGICCQNKPDILSCGPHNHKVAWIKISPYHVCCGNQTYNIKSQCCVNGCNGHLRVEPRPSDGRGCRNESEMLCCGPHGDKVPWEKTSEHHICCGNKAYTKTTQCCCFDNNGESWVKPRTPVNSECCETGWLPVRRRRRSVVEEARCGLERYNTVTHMCCVDQLFQRPTIGHTECCGRAQYSTVSHGCCNGVLHEAADSPVGCTHHQPLRHTPGQTGPCSGTSHGSSIQSPHGAYCCGQHEYDPVEQICCSGRSHGRLPETSCCGADAFSPWSNLTTSCSGAVQAMQRSPTVSAECNSGFQQRPLNHWRREDVCCQVFLGTVESVAKTTQELTVVMAHILRVNQSSHVTSEPRPRPLRISLHCDPSPMRPGEAYMWTEGDFPARLISNVTGLASPVHALLSRRQSLTCASEEDNS